MVPASVERFSWVVQRLPTPALDLLRVVGVDFGANLTKRNQSPVDRVEQVHQARDLVLLLAVLL